MAASSITTAVLLLLKVSAAFAGDLAVCPGESARYGDHKCNHDETHRVCATLLGKDSTPLNWGSGDFWEITGQKAFQWDDQIRANHGDSWCICMWATARLISSAGCDNVHLDCSATDVDYVLKSYQDGGIDLKPAQDCLKAKCGASGFAQLNDASLPVILRDVHGGSWSFGSAVAAGVLSVSLLILGALRLWRREIDVESATTSNELGIPADECLALE